MPGIPPASRQVEARTVPTNDPVPQPAHLSVAVPQSWVPSWATIGLLPADKSVPQREEKLTDVYSQPLGPPVRVSPRHVSLSPSQ